MNKKKILIIGGGFFGMYISEYLASQGNQVTICEKENDFMQRASYCNQARIHNGYHYPRSILTAFRSKISFPRFVEEFNECVVSSFEKYYAIGNILGKVTAKQFNSFCQKIGALCKPAKSEVRSLFSPKYIEDVFETQEYAFDSIKLKNKMIARVNSAGVQSFLNSKVQNIHQMKDERFEVQIEKNSAIETLVFDQIFNCTYSQLNQIVSNSGLPIIPLKHEMTEMCLVNVPDEIKNMGITVMCGPFFSTMPFPPEKLHSFSHVRYTPHFEWYDKDGTPYAQPHDLFKKYDKPTAWQHMKYDAKRYMPCLEKCEYVKSIWEVKTVLPRSEVDDSRPVFFKIDHGVKNFHCIMGGKIDNIYDAIDIINCKLSERLK